MKITGKPYLAIRRRRWEQQFEHSQRIFSSPLFVCCSFFLFSFSLLLNPCDEEQRTMLASPFEFGSRFLLCVCLVFLLWFSICSSLVFRPIPLFPVFFPLFFSCFKSPVFFLFPVPLCFLGFFFWFFIQCAPFFRLFSCFYKAREGLVSLPLEIVGIVEARDHGYIVGVVVLICWIFPYWTGLRQADDE